MNDDRKTISGYYLVHTANGDTPIMELRLSVQYYDKQLYVILEILLQCIYGGDDVTTMFLTHSTTNSYPTTMCGAVSLLGSKIVPAFKLPSWATLQHQNSREVNYASPVMF